LGQLIVFLPEHSFRMVFGETPLGFLSRRRAERAMALLQTTSRPVY
jgi:AraC-like DNA-binding protein